MEQTIIYLLSCVAVVSVSASASLLAIKKRMDIVGATVLAMIASFGGGIMRDLAIGKRPISLLADDSYGLLILLGFLTVFVLFHVGFLPKAREGLMKKSREFWFDLTDAVGLAAFAMAGIGVAEEMGLSPGVRIFCGCITGVGGGILRDMIASEIPLIFRKHIYLLPVVVGTAVTVFLEPLCGSAAAIALGMILTVGLRVLAILFRWNLPTPLTQSERDAEQEKTDEKEKTEEPV